ncbi:helix-hairpin-helix domain-containing protein [Nocardiopsis suaedae]|uniref:Helix-hairpin-helix domain-containing protein n=1 Tax=Nocardiopsis suaedae TaxID=3018444 RepID=A0ABT4TDY4_9ACTN|nr:helix-hairpin-helix domain-containing protein [Nocardiopsis suaedae]MDA2802927.1 helix-hairpin-helix domain-containing protein [Nocardiopsis suaedae]
MSPFRGGGRRSEAHSTSADRLRSATGTGPVLPGAGHTDRAVTELGGAAPGAPPGRPVEYGRGPSPVTPDGPPPPGPAEEPVPEVDLPAPPYALDADTPSPDPPAPGPGPSRPRHRPPAPREGREGGEEPLPLGYTEATAASLRPSLPELLAERLQLSAPDGRARLGRAGLGGLLLVCAAAVAATAWFTLGGPPASDPAPRLQADAASAPAEPSPAARSSADPAPPGAEGAAPQGEVTVHVGGEVNDPGLVTLPAGARVADAIEEAGGVADGADTGTLNLARPLADGEQILVGEEYEQPPPPAPGAAPPGGGEGALIDLNTATQEQLQTLPGVGPVLAERIIAFRTEHGGFKAVEQLQEVSGIGEKRYAELKDLVQVAGPGP